MYISFFYYWVTWRHSMPTGGLDSRVIRKPSRTVPLYGCLIFLNLSFNAYFMSCLGMLCLLPVLRVLQGYHSPSVCDPTDDISLEKLADFSLVEVEVHLVTPMDRPRWDAVMNEHHCPGFHRLAVQGSGCGHPGGGSGWPWCSRTNVRGKPRRGSATVPTPTQIPSLGFWTHQGKMSAPGKWHHGAIRRKIMLPHHDVGRSWTSGGCALQ